MNIFIRSMVIGGSFLSFNPAKRCKLMLLSAKTSALIAFSILTLLFPFSVKAEDPSNSLDLFLRDLHNGLVARSLIDAQTISANVQLWDELKPGVLLQGVGNIVENSWNILVTDNGTYGFFETDQIKEDPTVKLWLGRRNTNSFAIDARPFLNAIISGDMSPADPEEIGKFFYLRNGTLASYSRIQIERALQGMMLYSSLSAAERSVVFAQIAAVAPSGSFPSIPLMAQTALASGCSYSPGTATPCNNQVAVIWGHDPGAAFNPGLDGFNNLQTFLATHGYSVTTIDLDSEGTIVQAGDEAALSAAASAQTIIFNMHGGPGGSGALQCYQNVTGWQDVVSPQGPILSGPTFECCEKLRLSAVALNLPNSGSMSCAAPNPNERPTSDPSGSLVISDQRTASEDFCPTSATSCGSLCGGPGLPACPCGNPGQPICGCIAGSSAADGCPCELATPNPCYIHSNVTLFSKLGDRAAVFTTQCYGGQCVNGPENIRDFVTQSDYPGVAPTELCDDKQVVQDVSGLSVYCKNGSSSSNEPWNGAPAPVCSDPSAQLIPSSSSSMRTLQASIRMRGALSASQETQTCHPYYNSNGWLTYQTSRVGGQGATAIEFAPTVGGTAALSSFFLPVSSTKFEFTSPIDPSTCTLNMQAVAAPGISSTAPNFVNEKCDKLAAGAVLSNGLKTLSESKWNQEPTKLQDYYGADQSSWPWFVSATIKAKADNGVSLIGNEGATGKWIWGQKTAPNMIPPYLYSLGNITTGGTVFSARIPVEPTLSCCMPNIDWAKDMSDNWVPQKNGCKCQGNIGVSACFVGTCVSGDTKTEAPGMPASDCQNGTYKQFTGDIKLWTECCGQGSTNCEAYTDEPIDEPRDCREGDSYPITKRTYHRKARPYDTSPVIDCDPILIYQECKDDDSDRSVEKRARR